MGSPLRRPGVCFAIGVALLAVLSIAASLQLGLIRAMRPDIASVFFRALCLSSLLATVPIAMLWFLDRRERETPWLFAVTFFWGACIATGLALPFNTAFARIVDAWVTQNPMIEQVLGPDAGSMLAGIFGAMLGLVFQTRRRWLRILAPIVGLALALGAHFWNNALPLLFALAGAAAGEPPPSGHEPPPDVGFLRAFVSGSLTELTTFAPFVMIMTLALWRSGVWERRVIGEGLVEEVGRTVSPEEYDQVVRDRALRTRRIARMHPRESAALVNAQHELAFRKRRVRDEGEDPEHDRLVAGWREAIRRLRAVV